MTYALHPPDPSLAPLLARPYLTFSQPPTPEHRWLATPTPTVTLILNLAEAFAGLPRAFVAGPTDAPSVIDQTAAITCLDLKLTPLGAYTLLATPMSELTNRVADLTDLLPGVHTLTETHLVDRFLLNRAESGPRPAPEVAHAVRTLTRTHGATPIAALARETGWGRRHLAATFRRQVGLSPKTFARLARFNHLTTRLRTEGAASWTRLAEECGYYDQAHMNRDFREFAGTTPTDYLARQVSFVQYSWVSAA